MTTDPAANLSDVFEQEIGHRTTAISGVDNLWAMELDPDEATAEYKERALAPLREMLPESMLKVMEEQLDSPCTSEMASFERFVDFLDEDEFEVVIFDTAPTGHTLRLLQLPDDWSRVIEQAAANGRPTCVGPAQALAGSKEKFDRALATMKDPRLTKFLFVMRPETSSIDETERSMRELRKLGIEGCELVVNGVIPAMAATNAFFRAKRETHLRHLRTIEAADPRAKVVFLQAYEIIGLKHLRTTGRLLYDHPISIRAAADEPAARLIEALQEGDADPADHESLPVARVELGLKADPPHMVFLAGKGGVGKTLLSCIAAVNLADTGKRTLLVTTDPAAHLAHALDTAVGNAPAPVATVPNLWATRIDPKAEAVNYRERVLSEVKGTFTADRLAAMKEELDSPCTEEMAVFYAFVELTASCDYEVIVFDTAPTGHTLRLLRLPVNWSKQLEIKTFTAMEISEADAAAKSKFDAVIDRLQDPSRTAFIMVVYPEHTPIIEAHRATLELGTIGITPAFVIPNQVLTADTRDNRFFADRLKMQQHHLSTIRELFGAPAVQMPLLADEPRGIGALRAVPIIFADALSDDLKS